MRTRTKKHSRKAGLLLSAAAIAALMGGSAFTASNTFATGSTGDGVTGYGSTTVSGGTINSLAYNLNTTGDTITSVTLKLLGDTTLSAVSIGFNDGATTSCGDGAFPLAGTETTYTCTVSQSTATLVKTAVVIN